MQVGSEQWRLLLVQGALEMGLTLTPFHLERMGLHAQALLEWNRTTNLTAIIDPAEMAIKHFLDAIGPSPHIPSEGELLDIGTGAGFPGIPLKILRPGQPMTLIDGSRKKITFVKHLIRQLGLEKITAAQMRAEEMAAQPSFQGRFQAIICRAVADLSTIARMALPLLADDGKICVYQGPSEEPRRSKTTGKLTPPLATIVSLEYQLPLLGDRRTLVVMSKGGGCKVEGALSL
jgi:16S rRNA (guanine527-N7)-methyltransferase